MPLMLIDSEEVGNMGSEGRVQFDGVDLIENVTFERKCPEYLCLGTRGIKGLEPGCVRETG